MQEDVGSSRHGGGGEISFVNQKHPGRDRERAGFSSTIGLLKARLDVATLIRPGEMEARLPATVGGATAP